MEYGHAEHKDKHHVILERYEEELEDACEYARLAEEMPEESVGLLAIGRDEVTHANYLREILEEHDHVFSEEHEKKWHHVLKKYGWEA
jgi:ribonucleotide reductase beta subunit family protein with ferritin-like domain